MSLPRVRGAHDPESWAVIWFSHTEPRVRSYLWSLGIQPTAEAALTRAEKEAREDATSHRPPPLEPGLLRTPPSTTRGRPAWAVVWKSTIEPRVRHLLFATPQPSPELALEHAQRELESLGRVAPQEAVKWVNGTFYPVRLDLHHRGEAGTFYPVLVSMAVEVLRDPTAPLRGAKNTVSRVLEVGSLTGG